ncbi:MAG: hypothetical protein R3190_03655 [Thermoanaerobaculia bacterium]|nr:hypothetical protein [Thermoanaerobaculia bacterium]
MIQAHPTLAAVTLALAAAPLFPLLGAAARASERDQKPVVACTLGEPELRERAAKIRGELLPTVVSVAELARGYELRVPAGDGQLARLAEFVDLESRCCAFLDFEIRVESGVETLALVLTGPEGTKEVLAPLIERIEPSAR